MKFSMKLTALAVAMGLTGAASAQISASSLSIIVIDPTNADYAVLTPSNSPLTGTGATNTPAFTSTTSVNLATDSATSATWSAFTTLVGAAALSSLDVIVGGTSAIPDGVLSYLSSTIPGTITFGTVFANGQLELGNLCGTNCSANLTAFTASTSSFLGAAGDLSGSAGAQVYATGPSASLTLADFDVNGNFLNKVGTFTLNTSTGVGSFAPISTVPEPGAFALMGAGLLAVGAMVRRRTRG